ncbi:gasdermin-D-like [Grammomys surdaster]|uniref:gasdermin-D-like n=1 Tax=Grammomys surdaster TaxID=491861 RepID=UPI0010A049E8|nr:gasdermin-D-like [Grammomys surdaster]XP_028617360.1 gasdermin-D-like [Grammomys surdaster]
MTSAFQRAVKSVIQEVDHGIEDLIPVDCLQNSISFKPYSLLSRKLSSSCFWKPSYTFLNMSIKDILEPISPEPEPECIGHFQVSDVIDGNIQGSVVMSGRGEGRIAGAAAVSDSSSASMSVCILSVNLQTWSLIQRERHLQQPENTILQQLRSRGDDVFVITKVLQTKKELQITQAHSQESQGEGKGHQSQNKMVTIPAGSVLAFQVYKLLIGSSWGILLLPDEKERTFESSSDHRRGVDLGHHCFNLLAALQLTGEQHKFMSVSPDEIPEEEEFRKDFQGLCAEVKAGSLELGNLEIEVREQLLEDIGRILQDQPRLDALEASLRQGLCSGEQVELLDSPTGCILEYLVLCSAEPALELVGSIFFLLGALNVLSETQQQLLAKALEKTVLSKQLELVEHILEQSTPWQEQRSVSLPSRLLGDSWDEEAPIWVLLEECGLRLQVEPPLVHWEPTSQGPTCALYASLVLLSSIGHDLD